MTENQFELLLFLDAARRAVARVTALIPYFGYARPDNRHGRREPIAASVIANLLRSVGLDHLVALDLHAARIEGFFHVPVDNLTGVSVLCDELKRHLAPETVASKGQATTVFVGSLAHTQDRGEAGWPGIGTHGELLSQDPGDCLIAAVDLVGKVIRARGSGHRLG